MISFHLHRSRMSHTHTHTELNASFRIKDATIFREIRLSHIIFMTYHVSERDYILSCIVTVAVRRTEPITVIFRGELILHPVIIADIHPSNPITVWMWRLSWTNCGPQIQKALKASLIHFILVRSVCVFVCVCVRVCVCMCVCVCVCVCVPWFDAVSDRLD